MMQPLDSLQSRRYDNTDVSGERHPGRATIKRIDVKN